jgi:ribosomal protein S18 acetylase RimI-like enzyme
MDVVLSRCVAARLDALEWDGELRHDRPIIDATYARMQDGNALMLVAGVDDVLVGQIWIDFAPGRHASKLWALRVKAPWRRQRIGTRLIAAAERASEERGFRAVEIEVEPHNAAARQLYERIGYEYARDDAATGLIVMEKRLLAGPAW